MRARTNARLETTLLALGAAIAGCVPSYNDATGDAGAVTSNNSIPDATASDSAIPNGADAGVSGDDAGEPADAGASDAGASDGATPEAATCVADLNTDAKNCGRCGHECSPGLCSAGQCQPWIIAQAPVTQTPDALASDGTNLVWLDTGLTAVKQVPLAGGGGAITLASDASFTGSFMTRSGNKVTWTGGSSVWTATIGQASSGTKQPFNVNSSFPGTPYFIRSDAHVALTTMTSSTASDGAVLWTQTLQDCTLGSTSCVTLISSPTPNILDTSVAVIGASADAVYYLDAPDGQLRKYTLSTSSTAVVATGATAPDLGVESSAIDGTNAYWQVTSFGAALAGETMTTIQTVPLAGGTPNALASNVPGLVFSMASDDTNLYFTYHFVKLDDGGIVMTPGHVAYVPIHGGAYTNLATGIDQRGIVVAGGTIAWYEGATIYGMRTP